MRIQEVKGKAEGLVETGKEIEAEIERARRNVQNAQQRVRSAQADLASASETDEEGEPRGDVRAAQARLEAAIMELEYAQSEVTSAEAELEAVNDEKREVIGTLDDYHTGEGRNLSILQQLQAKQFGGNANAMAAAIAAQMNLAESTKARLYQSMGISYTAQTVSYHSGSGAGGVGGGISGMTSALRQLTDDEVRSFSQRLGWSSERIRLKCTIDADGVGHYKTTLCDLENKTHPCGVPYRRNRVTINGVQVEGVFPVFDAAFEVRLEEHQYGSAQYNKFCNEALLRQIDQDPELRSQFTKKEIADLRKGKKLKNYVWHHHEEPGRMQLVRINKHDKRLGGAAHTGGSKLWGPERNA